MREWQKNGRLEKHTERYIGLDKGRQKDEGNNKRVRARARKNPIKETHRDDASTVILAWMRVDRSPTAFGTFLVPLRG